MPRERRSDRRVPIRLVIDQFNGQEHWTGVGFNLNSGGVFLCQRPQPMPGQVALELKLPGVDESIWAQAEVRSVKNQWPIMGVGLAFTTMAKHHRALLRKWTGAAREQLYH